MRVCNAKPAVIAGGAIAGLACTLGGAIKGFRAVVLEQAQEFGGLGAGIQLAPDATPWRDSTARKFEHA